MRETSCFLLAVLVGAVPCGQSGAAQVKENQYGKERAEKPKTRQAEREAGEERGPLIVLDLPGSQEIAISGELRWRVESRQNYDFRDNAGSDPFFIDQRARIAFDFVVNERVRTFVQLQDARTFGEETSTIDRAADGFDLHQGFLDWKFGPEESDGRARIGRQEILLGDQRLVSPLDWATQGRSFDGARVDFDPHERVQALAFATVLRDDLPSNVSQGAYFGGLQLSGQTEDAQLLGDVYLFLLVDDETVAGGTHDRWTLGTRIKGQESGFDVGFEGALQFGEIDDADIGFGDAYALHVESGYTFGGCPWSPRVAAEFNFATGDDPSTPNDNERFNNLFPLAHAFFGYMDFALWENIQHFAMHALAKPADRTKLKLAWHNFHTDHSSDRFGGPVNLLRPAGVGGAAHMGDEVDLTGRQEFGWGMWGELSVGVFVPGDGVRDAAGSDDTALFFYYMMGLKF